MSANRRSNASSSKTPVPDLPLKRYKPPRQPQPISGQHAPQTVSL
jgi:hypothetical protein